MTRTELAKKIYDVAHLTGEFKLRSGQISNEYFDKYRFEAQPAVLREIAKQMVPLIPAGTEVLAGLEMGGIPIATALSLETGIPCAFVRKEAKEYGTCQFAEGLDLKGKKVLVIEDVVTTGGQVVLSTADLRSIGAIVTHVLCVIHRGPQFPEPKLTEINVTLSPLFKKADFN
ncbi:orotate phosphoribosyltransferase [Bdellovibrio sp. SKB1291214]|uniref:orotate phosphoribosyltransferase n=1 Tax=Bdellovibrio sp. SKB1291214 TaxID=1732569 RepID=UPI000B51DDBC|nr:orotate phosphoribosyltransferase [Bdellovibrio sp. SKB1291214]UYL09820.1 orotate phosphoribosyltransferase [Bdellovibrio sp. SKB1291214]